jgi:hypothetical protein
MGCRSFFELARWSYHLRRSAKMLNSTEDAYIKDMNTFERMSTSGLPLCRTSSLRTSPVAWVGGAATRNSIGAFLPLEGAPYVIHPNSRAFALAACHA